MTTRPSLSSHFLPIRPDWLAKRQEEILEPGLPIVDPHHHLWDRPGDPYMLRELLEDTGTGHNVVATVFVECRAMYRKLGPAELRSLGETEFVNGIAAMSASGNYGPTRAVDAIVGNVDLQATGARAGEILQQHVAASSGRFRGIRNVSAWHAGDEIKATTASPPEGLLRDRSFREGFACLAPLGLTFDSWLLHTQLDDLLDLARAFPETTIVMDHIGGPIGIAQYAGRRDEVFATWHDRIRQIAACPNVNVKVGGMAMRVTGFDFDQREVPAPSEVLADAWRPYVDACIAAFGVERCMFESNFPVDKGMCSYSVLWNAFKRLASGCSATEKQALFSGTAARVYRLDLAS